MVTLSWTRGQDTLTQSSNPDRSVLLCVLLEVKDNQDNSIYSCVASNPVSNHSVQLNITEICPLLVVRAAVNGGVETVEVLEGVNITLNFNWTEILHDDVLSWIFGNTDSYIAVLSGDKTGTLYHEQFKDRLQLDAHTGALTISNISINDSGFYKVQFISKDIPAKYFNVTVYEELTQPQSVIISNETECSDLCAVLCLAKNGPMVTLSWTRGRDTLTQSSNPNLSAPLYVLLEVKDNQDHHKYSCVASNPVSNHSVRLNITEICPLLGMSSVHCCGRLELVVRSVLSAVVGLVTVVILLDYFR
ncbi:CD48 antigen-like [Hoplias malabaricus]|uniref:CD48 antigen-like n=1 Tax=Hoplias malabaricus TaxID=27720 RepID=UPI0034618B45